jgi:hypothetical protein
MTTARGFQASTVAVSDKRGERSRPHGAAL